MRKRRRAQHASRGGGSACAFRHRACALASCVATAARLVFGVASTRARRGKEKTDWWRWHYTHPHATLTHTACVAHRQQHHSGKTIYLLRFTLRLIRTASWAHQPSWFIFCHFCGSYLRALHELGVRCVAANIGRRRRLRARGEHDLSAASLACCYGADQLPCVGAALRESRRPSSPPRTAGRESMM